MHFLKKKFAYIKYLLYRRRALINKESSEGTVASLGRLCLPDSLPFSKAEVNCFLHVQITRLSR